MGEGRERGENSYNLPNSYQNSQNNNYQQKRPNFETKNRFEAFREKENYNNSKSVFQNLLTYLLTWQSMCIKQCKVIKCNQLEHM